MIPSSGQLPLLSSPAERVERFVPSASPLASEQADRVLPPVVVANPQPFGQTSGDARQKPLGGKDEKGDKAGSGKPAGGGFEGVRSEAELSPEEQQQLEELKARDREVRTHEQAHMSAGGQYTRGGPTYSYQGGPDGRQYAVGGEVDIDTSKEKDPEATLRKAQVVQRAALAPANPSSQDHQVAAQAAQMAAEARMEIAQKRGKEMSGEGDEESAATGESGQAEQGGEAGKIDAAPRGDANRATSQAAGQFAAVAGNDRSNNLLVNLFA